MVKAFIIQTVVLIAALFFLVQLYRSRTLLSSRSKRSLLIGGYLGGIGNLLMWYGIPMGHSPWHLSIDLRYLMVMVAAFSGGPVAAVPATLLIAGGRLAALGPHGALSATAAALIAVCLASMLARRMVRHRLLQFMAMNIAALLFVSTAIARTVPERQILPALAVFWALSVVGASVTYGFIRFLRNLDRLQRDLEASEERNRNLVDFSPDGILVLQDARIESANRQAAAILGEDGSKPERLADKPVADYLHPDRRDDFLRMLKDAELRTGALPSREWPCVRADGSSIYIEASFAPVSSTRNRFDDGLMVVIRDISERRRVDEALRLSNQKLQRLFEQAGTGIALINLDGYPVDVNPALVAMLGFSREELLAKNHFEYTHPDDIYVDYEQYKALLANDIPFYQAEKRYKTSGGSLIWARLTVSLIRNLDEHPVLVLAIVEDVSERNRVLRAIEESEQKYASLFQFNVDPVFSIAVGGRFNSANRSCAEVSGYAREELMSLDFRQLVAPDDIALSERVFRHAMSGVSQSFELRMIHKNGSLLHLFVTMIPIVIDGQVVGVYGSAKDMTEQKRIEAELRESKEQVEEIFDSITDAFFSYDEHWRITYVNRESQRILNRPREDLLGRNIWEEYPVLVGTDLENKLRRAMAERRTVRFESHIPGLDSWYDVRGFPNREGLSVYLQDITELRRAAEAARINEERFQLLTESISDMVSKHDREGVYTYVSPSCERILGYDSEELTGRSAYAFIHEEDRNLLNESRRLVLESQSIDQPVYRIRRKDGTYVWVESSVRGVLDSDGRVAEMIVTTRDITLRKQAEERLRKANEELHRLSSLDGLTGIPNRRYFEEVYEREWKAAAREAKPLAIILCDIDYFKPYNDYYGHQGGDAILKQVAGLFRHVLKRPRDFAARYGGEEFIMILPDSDARHSAMLAEQLRAEVEKLRIPHFKSRAGEYVTMSLGVASMVPTTGADMKQLIESSDKALYAAKLQGRNRVVHVEDEPAVNEGEAG